MSPKPFSKTHYEKEEEERRKKEVAKTREEQLVKKASGIRARISREFGFMAKGAKVLPKVAARKGKAWMKEQIEAAKEKARQERLAEKEAKGAEMAAFKAESIKQAKIKGTLRAKKRGRGARGILTQLGQMGESMSVGKMLGVDTAGKKGQPIPSTSDYIFGGVGNQKKKKQSTGLLEIPEGFGLESITLTKKKKKTKKTKKRKR